MTFSKFKFLFSITTIAGQIFISNIGFADSGVCSHQTWDKTRCSTVAGGLAAGFGSGIYSAKKYSEAKSIEKNFSIRVFQHSNTISGENEMLVNKSTSTFVNGDRISIAYNLSEIDNREHHIKLMMDHASSARSTAASYAVLAMSATKTESVYSGNDANGVAQYTTHTVPDYAARASYGIIAANSLKDAADYDARAQDARLGGPVPKYEFTKKIDVETNTARVSSEYVKEKIARGGLILSIDRLPFDKFKAFKSLVNLGRAGIAGAVVGAGFAVEEAISGYATDKLNNKDSYAPSMSDDNF